MSFAIPEKFARVVDWVRCLGVPDVAIAPCRTIPITPAVLEADRRRQLAPVSTTAEEWRSRTQSTLATAASARPAPSTSHVTRPSKRMENMVPCAGRCGRKTKPGARGGLCYSCRQWADREATAAAKGVAPTPMEKGDSGQSPEQTAGGVDTTPLPAVDQVSATLPEIVHPEEQPIAADSHPLAQREQSEPAVSQQETDQNIDEALADEVWHSLSIEDKWALLDGMVQA